MTRTQTLNRRTGLLSTATLALVLAGGLLFSTGQANAGPMHGPAGAEMMGGPMMAGGRHLDRMLDAVDASAEQRSQVKAIAEAARADLRSQHASGAGLREQTMQLFAQPTVDARAAEALRQQMLVQHDAASKRMMQAMLDISRVLSPEQRQRLAAQMQQRHAMMDSHRRGAAPAAPKTP